MDFFFNILSRNKIKFTCKNQTVTGTKDTRKSTILNIVCSQIPKNKNKMSSSRTTYLRIFRIRTYLYVGVINIHPPFLRTHSYITRCERENS